MGTFQCRILSIPGLVPICRQPRKKNLLNSFLRPSDPHPQVPSLLVQTSIQVTAFLEHSCRTQYEALRTIVLKPLFEQGCLFLIQPAGHCRSESCCELDRDPERGHVGFYMFNFLSFMSTSYVSKTFSIP